MDLKESAVVNLGRIAAACAGYEEGSSPQDAAERTPETDPFAPFVERTLKVMQKLTNYFHEQVRVKSLGVLRNMVLGSYQVSKRPGNMQVENQRRCQHIVTVVLPMLVHRMNKDFHREVCAETDNGGGDQKAAPATPCGISVETEGGVALEIVPRNAVLPVAMSFYATSNDDGSFALTLLGALKIKKLKCSK